eukprot:COSAG02_NODE_61_length_43452_cov_741.297804_15_plen_132_part_00
MPKKKKAKKKQRAKGRTHWQAEPVPEPPQPAQPQREGVEALRRRSCWIEEMYLGASACLNSEGNCLNSEVHSLDEVLERHSNVSSPVSNHSIRCWFAPCATLHVSSSTLCGSVDAYLSEFSVLHKTLQPSL